MSIYHAELARRHLIDFTTYTKPNYIVNWHHQLTAYYFDLFVQGKIKNLMVFEPPQHGKSELVTRRGPAFLLGKIPDAKISLTAYSATLASSFNRDIQNIIVDPRYYRVFTDTNINCKRIVTVDGARRNNDIFDVINANGKLTGGYLTAAGIGGALTGITVDYAFMDDPVKDKVEAKSPAIQLRNKEWYDNVLLTRLHNKSQIMLTMTRWDTNDLAGVILRRIKKGLEDKEWTILTIPALKEGPPTEEDPRQDGEPLWPEKHELKKILGMKAKAPETFNSLYQQNPKPSTEALIYPEYKIIDKMPDGLEHGYGLDFGFNDPQALIDCAVDFDKKAIYVDEIVYRSGLNNNTFYEICKQKQIDFSVYIFADNARPENIDQLAARPYNMRISACKKGKDSVLTGIKFLQEFTIYVTRRSLNIIDEFDNYQWLMGADGLLDIPIDKYNHAMDAIRYYFFTRYNSRIVSNSFEIWL